MTATNPAVSPDDMRSRTFVTRCYPSRDRKGAGITT